MQREYAPLATDRQRAPTVLVCVPKPRTASNEAHAIDAVVNAIAQRRHTPGLDWYRTRDGTHVAGVDAPLAVSWQRRDAATLATDPMPLLLRRLAVLCFDFEVVAVDGMTVGEFERAVDAFASRSRGYSAHRVVVGQLLLGAAKTTGDIVHTARKALAFADAADKSKAVHDVLARLEAANVVRRESVRCTCRWRLAIAEAA